jgi:uncharacterized protein YuzE
MPLALARQPVAPPVFSFDYDSHGDVLYITWGPEQTVCGEDVGPNAIVRFTRAGKPAGVTVYDVNRSFTFNPAADQARQAAAIAMAVLSSYWSRL